MKWLSVGSIIGVVYLVTIMWWVTGYTPENLVNAVTKVINQPLQQIAEVLK